MTTQETREHTDETDTTVSQETPTHVPSIAVREFIDTGAGASVLTKQEAWVKENAQDPANDGRSPTNTYFHAGDVDGEYPHWQAHRDESDKRSWETLAVWNDGAHSNVNSRGSQNWEADKTRWIDAFGDKMGAKEYQQERAAWVLERIDMNTYVCRNSSTMTINTELIIICILSLIVDQDIVDFENRALKRSGTRELLDDIGADVDAYERIRSLLRQHDGDLLFTDT